MTVKLCLGGKGVRGFDLTAPARSLTAGGQIDVVIDLAERAARMRTQDHLKCATMASMSAFRMLDPVAI